MVLFYCTNDFVFFVLSSKYVSNKGKPGEVSGSQAVGISSFRSRFFPIGRKT